MTQISKKLVRSDLFYELFDNFDWLIINLKDRNEVYDCFQDLLTKHERVMIAKRIAILFLLSRGLVIEDVSRHLKVSTSTVLRLKRLVDNDSRGYNIIVDKLNGMQKAKRRSEKIKIIFDFFEAMMTAKTNMTSRARLLGSTK